MHRHVNVVFYFDFKIIYREQFSVQRCLLICDPMFIIIALIFSPNIKKCDQVILADFLHVTSAIHSISQLEESK